MLSGFNKKSACTLTLLLLMSSIGVRGAHVVEYNGGDNAFHFTGNTGLEKKGQIVSLKVTKKGEAEKLFYIRQTETDERGNYDFFVEIPEYGEALYTLNEDNKNVEHSSLYKSTKEEVNNALVRLNSEEKTADVITSEYKILGIDTEEFNDLNKDSLLCNYLDSVNTYNSLEEFKNYYHEGRYLTLIMRSSSEDETQEIIQKNISENILSQKNAGKTYISLNKAEQNEILSEIYKKRFNSPEELINAIHSETILYSLNNTSFTSEKYALIESNNDFIMLDLQSVKKLGKNTDAFKSELCKGTYESIDSLKNEFTRLYKKYLKQSDKDSSGGSSGGGGGSSDGPIKAQVDKNIINQNKKPDSVYFKDIENVSWAQEAINALSSKGVINGKGNYIFSPDENITRAEFTKIIVCAFGFENTNNKDNNFSDVKNNFWAKKYIDIAYSNGIITGNDKGLFMPDEKISRQDLSVICYRAMLKKENIKAKEKELSFEDSESIADYAVEAVKNLYASGYLNGKGNNRFEPGSYATRAETAKLVYEITKGMNL